MQWSISLPSCLNLQSTRNIPPGVSRKVLPEWPHCRGKYLPRIWLVRERKVTGTPGLYVCVHTWTFSHVVTKRVLCPLT